MIITWIGAYLIFIGIMMICGNIQHELSKKMENKTGLSISTAAMEGFRKDSDGKDVYFIVGTKE